MVSVDQRGKGKKSLPQPFAGAVFLKLTVMIISAADCWELINSSSPSSLPHPNPPHNFQFLFSPFFLSFN